MSKEVAEAIVRAGCVLKGTFRLSSGRLSTVYVDVRRLFSHPQEVRVVVNELARVISGIGCDLISGIETGGIPLAAMVAYAAGKPMVYVRKRPKEHGTQSYVEGDVSVGRSAVLVDDVATTGSSLLRAASILREASLTLEHAVVVVNREEGAVQALSSANVRLHSLTTLREIVELAGASG